MQPNAEGDSQDANQLLDAAEAAISIELEQANQQAQKKPKNDWAVSPERKAALSSYESIDQVVPSSGLLNHHAVVGHELDADGLPAMGYARTVIFLCVGVGTAIVNLITHDITALIWESKLALCQQYLDENRNVAGGLAFVGIGVLLTLVSGIVILWKKSAAGSGYPEVLAYLNGVDVPFTFRSLFVKMISCILINSASMPVGLEGPVINMAGIVGEKTSLGVSWLMRLCSKDLARNRPRQPDFRRAFIVGGLAGGVSVSLGAPVGGLLFVWEEMSTRWHPSFAALTLATSVTAVVLNTVIHGLLVQGDWETFLQISPSESLKFPRVLGFLGVDLQLLPAVVVVALVIGVVGGAWTYFNSYLKRLRNHTVCHPGLKIFELVVVAIGYLSLVYGLMFVTPCMEDSDSRWHIRGPCGPGEYSTFGSLVFAPVPDGIQTLFVTSDTSYSASVLLLAIAVYGVFSCITSGSFACGGLIVPSLMNGALIGHLIGNLGQLVGIKAMNPGFLALIGAGCFFSAVTRKTFSIVIIMVEMSNNVRNMLPLLLGVVISKMVSGLITPSLFYSLIELKAIPFLPAHLNVPLAHTVHAGDVMSKEVVVVPLCAKVGDIVTMLNSNNHHAFPVSMGRKVRQDQMVERRNPVMGTLHRSWSRFITERVHSSQLTFYHPEHEAALRKKEQLETLYTEPEYSEDVPINPQPATEVYGGMILRSQLLRLLAHPKCFSQRNPYPAPGHEQEFAEESRYLSAEDVDVLSLDMWMAELSEKTMPSVSPDDWHKFLDLSPYYNSSALSIQEDCNLSILYKSFLALGLRHIAIVNERDTPVGMITRFDLLPSIVKERMHKRLGYVPAKHERKLSNLLRA